MNEIKNHDIVLGFDPHEWSVATQIDGDIGEQIVKFIIFRLNSDGSRDVISKDGKVYNVPHKACVETICEPMFIVKSEEFTKLLPKPEQRGSSQPVITPAVPAMTCPACGRFALPEVRADGQYCYNCRIKMK